MVKIQSLALALLLFTSMVFAQDSKDVQDKQVTQDKQVVEDAPVIQESEADLWGDEAWAEVSDETSGDEATSDLQWTGFVAYGLGMRTSDDDLFKRQQTLHDWRFHGEMLYQVDGYDLNVKADVMYDDVLSEALVDWRDVSLSFSLGKNTDVSLGRQISTWGTGDLLFLNDFFPKDWQSFFSGRDVTYLKAPANALRMQHYFKPFNVDWVITPEFEPDRYINGERFALYSPAAQSLIGGQEVIKADKPNKPEYALRLFKQHKGIEYAVYAYHGFEKTPEGSNNEGLPTFHRKQSLGFSVRGSLWGGLFNIEAAQHRALDDKLGKMPNVKNGQNRWLLGYEHELVKKLNWSTQYYVEQTHDVTSRAHREVWTQRLNYMTHQDKTTWSLFAFYSPTDEDSYLRPNIQYRHNDHWRFDVGANLFDDKRNNSFFGQFEKSSNAYFNVKYQF
ncbi:hypothetical protein [Marinicella rhabdoformis]|uniref:hypothetical protein n=1 Tax=Marinicella rhabdoformis TaxID=2580566 RepID=UPI0012AEB2DF|nr:hypothetical protein [Marinicella rhabdoformis]